LDQLNLAPLDPKHYLSDTLDEKQKNIVNALKSIVSAKLIDNGSEISFLKCDEFTLNDFKRYEKLLIRESYDTLLTNTGVWESMDNPISDSTTGKGVTIVGTPGIGKSIMLLFLVYVFYNARVQVAYHHHSCPNDTFILDPIRKFVGLKKSNPPEFRERVALYDSVTAYAYTDVVILTISPRRDHAENEFKKAQGHKRGFMPLWSKYEVEQYCKVCLSYPKLDYVSLKRYETFGGVPRKIFSGNVRTIDGELNYTLGEVERTIDDELNYMLGEVEKPVELLKFTGGHYNAPPACFHGLILMKPTENLLSFSYYPASLEVTKKLYSRCKSEDLSTWLQRSNT
jgi:hypothetical protein